jgi:hypothetical protein
MGYLSRRCRSSCSIRFLGRDGFYTAHCWRAIPLDTLSCSAAAQTLYHLDARLVGFSSDATVSHYANDFPTKPRLGDLVCLGVTSCGSLQHCGCNDSRAIRGKLPDLRATAMAHYLYNHRHAHRRIPDEHVRLLGDPLDRIVGRYPSRLPLHHLCRGLGHPSA